MYVAKVTETAKVWVDGRILPEVTSPKVEGGRGAGWSNAKRKTQKTRLRVNAFVTTTAIKQEKSHERRKTKREMEERDC